MTADWGLIREGQCVGIPCSWAKRVTLFPYKFCGRHCIEEDPFEALVPHHQDINAICLVKQKVYKCEKFEYEDCVFIYEHKCNLIQSLISSNTDSISYRN